MRFRFPTRTCCALILGLAALGASGRAVAQDAEAPAPPVKKGTARITFLPPPMEGTLSLGIYDKAGKLVRVLAREATEKDFTIGLNGLITAWDGKDDAGKVVAPGNYFARGYSVGEIDVEGVAYHCNDWMLDDESPRIRRVLGLALARGGPLTIWAEGADGKTKQLHAEQAGKFDGEIPADPQFSKPGADAVPARRAFAKDGKVVLVDGAAERTLELPEVARPLDASLGRDGVWIVDQVGEKFEVKEYTLDGVFRRRLTIDPAEPAPRRIFASRTSDLIFLMEEKPGLQRVRGLALEQAPAPTGKDDEPPTSTWKTVLSKTITASETFQSVAGKLGRIVPFTPRDKFAVSLLPNELMQRALTTVNVTIGFDATGSFLRTTDGLPLLRVTEAPHVKWAVIGYEGSGKQLTIFQSDGAVVEEFRARKLANMMAFDAGELEWPPVTK